LPCLRITVRGKVQGVWFRKYCFDKAQEMKLCGWVRNHKDGTVRLEIEGESETLDRYCEWLWEGSPQSDVIAVERMEQKFEAGFSDFEIKE